MHSLSSVDLSIANSHLSAGASSWSSIISNRLSLPNVEHIQQLKREVDKLKRELNHTQESHRQKMEQFVPEEPDILEMKTYVYRENYNLRFILFKKIKYYFTVSASFKNNTIRYSLTCSIWWGFRHSGSGSIELFSIKSTSIDRTNLNLSIPRSFNIGIRFRVK